MFIANPPGTKKCGGIYLFNINCLSEMINCILEWEDYKSQWNYGDHVNLLLVRDDKQHTGVGGLWQSVE